jgi:integrase
MRVREARGGALESRRGGRPAKGCVKWRRNAKTGRRHWHVRLTLADGSRPWVALDPAILEDEKAAAEACGKVVSDEARVSGLLPDTVKESADEWFKRFYDAKEAKGLSTAKEMRGRYKKWSSPLIGAKDMRAVTNSDLEAIVRSLDRAVHAFMKEGPGAGRLAPSSATNIWGDVQHAFAEAKSAKDPGLRVLTVNPAADVRGPDPGDDRQGQILYGDELSILVAGEAVEPVHPDVPLYRRQTYAVVTYGKLRASEAEALKPEDVDLDHMTIRVTKQADRKTKERKGTKATKTKRMRTVDIEPHVLPLVRWLVKHPQGKGGRLLRMPPPEDRAELLRKDLHTVGITREALFIEGDPHERAIVFHDLRDTGLTHMAVRGDKPLVIQWTAGHTDFKTTQGYLDRAEVERHRIGLPLPPLPPTLISGRRSFASVSDSGKTSEEIPNVPNELLRPQRELNPCYRRERPVS